MDIYGTRSCEMRLQGLLTQACTEKGRASVAPSALWSPTGANPLTTLLALVNAGWSQAVGSTEAACPHQPDLAAPAVLNIVLVPVELTVGTSEQRCVLWALFRHPPQRGGQRLRLCAHGSLHGLAHAQRGGQKAAALGQ